MQEEVGDLDRAESGTSRGGDQRQVIALDADAGGVHFWARKQKLRAADAVGDDRSIDVGLGFFDAKRQQARVGSGERLIRQSLAAMDYLEHRIALAVHVIRNVVDTAVAWREQQTGHRGWHSRDAVVAEGPVRADAREPNRIGGRSVSR